MPLATKTTHWVEQKLITAEQRAQILAFERGRGNSAFWRWAFILAGLLIGLGVCLVVAANWAALPDGLKLAGAFGLLAGLIYGVYDSLLHARKGLKELFAVLTFLMIGATIGLIGQVFQLSGGWHRFALGWAVLGIPFIVVSRSVFFNMGWLCLVVSVLKWQWLEPGLTHMAEQLDVFTVLVIIGLWAIGYFSWKGYQAFQTYSVLPRAVSRLALWLCYAVICFVGIRWGVVSSGGAPWGAYLIVFGFLAGRMYQSVREQNSVSFKRNAILAEIYIFVIFASRFGNLFASGVGFIAGGLLVLLFIYLLRRTTRYIKTMEVFK